MMGKRKVFDTLDPAAPAGPSVSDTLREARESLGYDLREVASMLRIRYPYLQAIETGRFEELPGTAYAAGFLRSYAEYLGLDPEAVVARYKEEAAGHARSQQLYFPTPVPEGRVPGGAVLLGTMVLASIVYGGWYYLSATDRSMVDLVPTLPDRLVSLLDTLPFSGANQPPSTDAAAPAVTVPVVPVTPPVMTAEAPAVPPAPGGASTPAPIPPPAPTVVPSAPAPSPVPPVAAPPAAPPAAAPAPVAGVPATPAPPSPVPSTPLPAVKPPAVASAPAPAPVAAPPVPAAAIVPPAPAEEDETEGVTQEPTPLSPGATSLAGLPPAPPPASARAAAEQAALPSKIYGSQNQSSRIQLRATQDSWIQVRDGNGEIIFTRVLKPGDVYRVPDRAGIRVRTGNAGGLTIVTDGIEGAPLGAVGQVLRDVALDQHTPTLRTNGAQ